MNVLAKKNTIENCEENYRLFFWCLGCKDIHAVDKKWDWNGSFTEPTISPSIFVEYGNGEGSKRCHSFITDGLWQYLSDCTHSLACAYMLMVPIPETSKRLLGIL